MTGIYRITFNQPFVGDVPTVTANAWPVPGQGNGPYVVIITDLSNTFVELRVYYATLMQGSFSRSHAGFNYPTGV